MTQLKERCRKPALSACSEGELPQLRKRENRGQQRVGHVLLPEPGVQEELAHERAGGQHEQRQERVRVQERQPARENPEVRAYFHSPAKAMR